MFTLLVIKIQKDTFSHLSDYQKLKKKKKLTIPSDWRRNKLVYIDRMHTIEQ